MSVFGLVALAMTFLAGRPSKDNSTISDISRPEIPTSPEPQLVTTVITTTVGTTTALTTTVLTTTVSPPPEPTGSEWEGYSQIKYAFTLQVNFLPRVRHLVTC